MTREKESPPAKESAISGGGPPEKAALLSPAQKAHLRIPRQERVELFQTPAYRLNLQKAGDLPQGYAIPVPVPEHARLTIREKDGKSAEDGRIRETRLGTITVSAPAYILFSSPAEGNVTAENLKIACRYDWEISGNGGKKRGTFETEDIAPRLIRLDGVPNVRDLGGRIGLDGRRIRQGMLYRSSGLNDNARPRCSYDENDLSPEMIVRKKACAANLEMYSGMLRHADTVKILPYTLDDDWTVFIPGRDLKDEDYMQIAGLRSIPDILLGVKGKIFTADSDRVTLPRCRTYEHAILMKSFEAPEDGFMPVGCSADYFFQILLNGRIGLDLLTHGDGHPLYRKENYLELLPVKKGNNLLTVHLRSGNGGWVLVFGRQEEITKLPVSTEEKEQMLTRRISEQEFIFSREIISGRIVGFIPGRTRLTEESREYLVRDLGIRSDVDLRGDTECRGMTGSPAGKSVRWLRRPCGSYAALGSDFGKEGVANVLRELMKKENCPAIFHCIGGQDRTGIIAFLLNGLLGAQEEELYLDWEVTAWMNGDSSVNHRNFLDRFVSDLTACPGKTLNGQIEACVLSLGITPEEIRTFREFMLEPQ